VTDTPTAYIDGIACRVRAHLIAEPGVTSARDIAAAIGAPRSAVGHVLRADHDQHHRKAPAMAASLLTPELSAAIVELVRRGIPVHQAAEHVGVSRYSVGEWIRRGEDRDDRPGSELYERFTIAVRAARAARLAELLAMVDEGAVKDWRAAAWAAERGWPEEFGQRQKLEHSGAGGEPLLVQLEALMSIPDDREAAEGRPRLDAETDQPTRAPAAIPAHISEKRAELDAYEESIVTGPPDTGE